MKLSPILTAAALTLWVSAAQAQDANLSNSELYDEVRETTVAPLFDALKTGDLAGIKTHLHADYYEQYRVLFEQNTEYGQFLRDYYADSEYELVGVRREKGVNIAEVKVYWPGGREVAMDLQVDGDGAQRKIMRNASGG